jgi:hypothetical protein
VTTQEATASPLGGTKSEEDHWTCCENEDVGLCGTDVRDLPFTEFEVASCIVCEDLSRTAHCPLGPPCGVEP